MDQLTQKPIIFAAVLAFATGIVLGLLNSLFGNHHGAIFSATDIAMTSTFVAGLGLFVGHQLRANRNAGRASAQEEQSAKMFNADPQAAVVYIFRDAFFARLVGFDVQLDGHAVGQTRGKTFYRLTLPPGEHVLNSVNPQDGSQSPLALSTAPGQIRYLEHSVRFGAKGPKHGFVECDDASGRERVRRCRLLNPGTDGAAQPVPGTLAKT
jgi:hypothetical protein